MSLSIRTGTPGDRIFAMALHGEMDYATVQHFREEVSALLATGVAHLLVIDLAGVSFVDSTGVGTLVVARRICAEVGVRMVLRNVNPFIARLFAVLGVCEILGVPAPPGTVTPGRQSPPAQRGGETLPQPV